MIIKIRTNSDLDELISSLKKDFGEKTASQVVIKCLRHHEILSNDNKELKERMIKKNEELFEIKKEVKAFNKALQGLNQIGTK